MIPQPEIEISILRGVDKSDPIIQTICIGIKATRDGVEWCWKGPEVCAGIPDTLLPPYAKAFKGAVEAMLNDPHTAEFVRKG